MRAVFNSRSMKMIMLETNDFPDKETGGILLGRRIRKTIYIIETVLPGSFARHSDNRFEYDTEFVDYLANKLSRVYKKQLEIVGIWHRHLGNLDEFSLIDQETNRVYAKEVGAPMISGIVNVDPKFRLSLFCISEDGDSSKIGFEVNDDAIKAKGIEQVVLDPPVT